MQRRGVTLEHGLLPLLDIAILLLGLFLVMQAQTASSARRKTGVFASKAFVLLEIAARTEGGEYRVFATDDNGARAGAGVQLSKAGDLVEQGLRRVVPLGQEAGVEQAVVVVGFANVFEADSWKPSHMAELRRALSKYRMVMLWSE